MSVWDTVTGQNRAVALLRHDVESGQIPHAYLFRGMAAAAPRQAALAFAAACLCPRHGCGECASCRRALRGVHPDVDVVEPAGMQLLVDQVREIIRSVWRTPAAGGDGPSRRVVVVDQADRMNPNAQNAFLKALEEPPPSAVIVLVAPAAEALLETVRSRCREVTFRPLSEAEVTERLRANGVSERDAKVWARVGGGLDRARVLAGDEGARERRRSLAELVLQAPRDPGDALQAAEWLAGQTRGIRDRVAEEHRSDLAEHGDWYRETKRAADDRLRREQRRAEQDALEFSLDDIASVLRDLLVAVSDSEAALLNEDLRPAVLARAGHLGADAVPGLLACLGEVEEARRRLRSNTNVLLTMERVLLALHEHLA